MNSPLPANPQAAIQLCEHLALWGDISRGEVETLRVVTQWLPAFVEAGVLEAVVDDTEAPVSWHLSPRFIHLLDSNGQHAARWACFSVPSYRAYLIGILAEGLVSAARAGMTSQLEDWTQGALAALVPEINETLNAIETAGRLVDLPVSRVKEHSAQLPGRDGSFSSWDQALLGHSGRPDALFDFVLRRFAPFASGPAPVDDPPAVLRPLSLNREDGFGPGQALLPAAWNTRRTGIHGGIAIFDELGCCLYNKGAPLTDVLPDLLQDAIIEHPFYAAVVHLAIGAWRSPASSMPVLEIFVPCPGSLHDASILVGTRGVGRLADLLGDLVRSQGFAPFGLVKGRVPDALMGNLLRNLLELRVLCQCDDLLVLDKDYQSSLMAHRLRTVFRPGEELQKRMVEDLATRASIGGGS